ncbi:MAG: thioredoxin family protein [Eubacterium sp.]
MIEEIKNSDFTDVLNSKLAVVDFSAVWCGPCQMLAPIMEELSDEMDGEVDFFSADVDENRDLAYQFDIQSIPAIVKFLQTEKRLQER